MVYSTYDGEAHLCRTDAACTQLVAELEALGVQLTTCKGGRGGAAGCAAPHFSLPWYLGAVVRQHAGVLCLLLDRGEHPARFVDIARWAAACGQKGLVAALAGRGVVLPAAAGRVGGSAGRVGVVAA